MACSSPEVVLLLQEIAEDATTGVVIAGNNFSFIIIGFGFKKFTEFSSRTWCSKYKTAWHKWVLGWVLLRCKDVAYIIWRGIPAEAKFYFATDGTDRANILVYICEICCSSLLYFFEMSSESKFEFLFRQGLHAVDSGDENRLRQMLLAHPELATESLRSPGKWLTDQIGNALKTFFKDPYLLWFVSEDAVRNNSLPSNIASIAKSLLIRRKNKMLKACNVNWIMGSS